MNKKNKYIVTIQETLTKEILVEANSKSEALEQVQESYFNSDIILYPEDCDVDTDFDVMKNIF